MASGLPVASRLLTFRDDRRGVLILAGAGTVACIAVSTAAATDAATSPGLVALAHATIVGLPIAVGLHAWYTGLNERFGLLLAGIGGWAFLTTLAESSDELLYTIGRMAGWGMELLLVVLFLAFPSGRLRHRTDRLLVAAMGIVLLTLFAPRLLLAERFEVPSPYTSCVRDCPANALFLLDREPALVDTVMRPLGVVAVLLVMVGVMARLRQRMVAATPRAQRLHAPVLTVATGRAAVLAVGITARELQPSGRLLEGTAWLLALAIPLLALAFLAGLLRWRLFAVRALERLAACVRTMPDAVTLRRAFSDAFEDPSIDLAFPTSRAPSGWVDAHGRPASLPAAGSGLLVSAVRGQDGRTIAAIVHDEALCDQPQLLEAGLAMAEVALKNQRLALDAEDAMREVRASRARIAAGAERERHRIEQDLHDGAQQRLVALRIELELAAEVVRSDPERGALLLEKLEQEVDEALEELRSLAHGVYPPLLADSGLVVALRAVAARCPLPVRVDVRAIGRYAPEVESAVYFCVLEALQNVLKHASGAGRAWVDLDGGVPTELRVSVRDDGAGASQGALRDGAGIVNMRDRLLALGGELEVTSIRGRGTVVRGRVPVSQR
jgi:signal transduction histidine kinase